jgi:hypothetical protein
LREDDVGAPSWGEELGTMDSEDGGPSTSSSSLSLRATIWPGDINLCIEVKGSVAEGYTFSLGSGSITEAGRGVGGGKNSELCEADGT